MRFHGIQSNGCCASWSFCPSIDKSLKLLCFSLIFKDQMYRELSPLAHLLLVIHMVMMRDDTRRLSKLHHLKEKMRCIILYLVVKPGS